MPDISLTMVVVLCLAALAAGWIDAVVGGGGLLLLPALLLGLPNGASAAQYALGTNKAVAIVGTTGAAVTYARKHPGRREDRRTDRPGRARRVDGRRVRRRRHEHATVLKPVIMVVLLGVGAFVILRPAFGTRPPPRRPSPRAASSPRSASSASASASTTVSSAPAPAPSWCSRSPPSSTSTW